LSRQAAVVGGAAQWVARLRMRAAGQRTEAEGMEHAGKSEGAVQFVRREASALDRMASFIERLDQETRPPAGQTWPDLVRWAEHARRTFIPTAEDWPEREREADEMIGELLTQMGSAAAVGGEVTIERFVESVRAAVEGRREAEGSLGSGVVVGSIGSLRGLDFD